MSQHEGRHPADPLRLSSVHIVNQASEATSEAPGWVQQYTVMPLSGENPLQTIAFPAMADGPRPKEGPGDIYPSSGPWRTPQTELLRSLALEPATRRIERSVGVRGEGPAVAFNSTSLRALIAANPEKAVALLELYYPIYSASFPDPDERLPYDTLLSLLKDPRFSINVDILTSERGILGGYQTHVADVDGELVSLGDYLCIDNQVKGMGIAQLVYRSTIADRRERLGAIAHFGEVNDPILMDAAQQAVDRKSGTDPEARLRFWEKQGRLMLDVPWVQPATAPGLVPVEYMMLTVHHLDQSRPLRITGETVQKVWDAYYLPLAEVAPVHETRREMERLLEPYRGREVPLLPLTTPRSFIGRV